MYRHRKIYELRYTDVDAYDVLKPSALLSFLEESACLSADELGFGYADVAPKNMGFVIVNWYIELFRPIKLGDKLELHTWPLKPRHSIFLRDYELYSGGEKVGVATARWCLIDAVNFAVLPVNAFFKEGDFEGYNTERSIDFKAWKIPEVKRGKKVLKRKAGYSDCDHYFHVNNTKYADFLTDAFTIDELKGKYMNRLQITYIKQCKEGEKLEFWRADDEGFTLVEGRVKGEARVRFSVGLDEV